MHDVRRVLERRPPQTTRVRRRPEPQLVHDRRPRVRTVDDVLVPPEPGVAAAIPKQRREALVLVVLVREPRDEAVDPRVRRRGDEARVEGRAVQGQLADVGLDEAMTCDVCSIVIRDGSITTPSTHRRRGH